MNTLFECWNAGVVEWDGLSSPRLRFSFPVPSHDALAFFLLSARMSQLISKQEWGLNFAEQAYSVPHFPVAEVSRLLGQFPSLFGYAPVLSYSLPFKKDKSIPVLSKMAWVHLASGHAYSYAPFVGRRCSLAKLYKKSKGIVVASSERLSVQFDADGVMVGTGCSALMEQLALNPGYRTTQLLLHYFEAKSGKAFV